MRRLILALAGAGSAVLAASAANAQYYGAPYGYNDNGYNRAYGDASVLERRIYNVLRSLDGVRPDQREQLRREALSLDRELRFAARNGLTQFESHNLDLRIDQLEHHQAWARDGYGFRSDRGEGQYSDEPDHRHRRYDRSDD